MGLPEKHCPDHIVEYVAAHPANHTYADILAGWTQRKKNYSLMMLGTILKTGIQNHRFAFIFVDFVFPTLRSNAYVSFQPRATLTALAALSRT